MMKKLFKFKFNFTSELYLLIATMIFHFILTTSQCIEDRSKRTYFTIACSTDIDKHGLEFIVDPDVKLTIKCINIVSYTELEKLLPHVRDLGDFITVQLINCPLGQLTSLGQITQQLGIRYFKQMHYVNYKMTTDFRRENLQDFPEMIQKLILEVKPVMNVTEDLFADKSLRHLKHLCLYGELRELHSKLFENLSNLLTLHVETNLKHLPNKLLEHQVRLKRLNLANNQLGINFNNNVAYRNLQSLDNSSLKVLVNLMEINFNNNFLHSLPERLFEYNHRLGIVNIIETKVALKRLPNALLAGLANLREVKIECDLEMVPFNLFQNSTNIAKIDMSHNKLVSLPVELFQSQMKLEHLDLSQNKLKNLHDNLFENLRKLVTLKLAYNDLKDVDIDR